MQKNGTILEGKPIVKPNANLGENIMQNLALKNMQNLGKK